jgi:formylglycine-generating enzyme required for sulfatase activity
VNGEGQTMVVIPGPAEFLMGSPSGEKGRQEEELQHTRRIERTFALAAKPVTLQQYQEFEPGFHVLPVNARAPDMAAAGTDWYRAAGYCNWLSAKEGIAADQWCYEIKGGQTNLKANYLNLGGYRLPSEAEMEYATRAGAVTARYYGETEALLANYAWYLPNSQEMIWPVGRLKPNDFGLFDTHGNVYTWCQENRSDYPKSIDLEADLVVKDRDYRVLRGGSFDNLAARLRSAARANNLPTHRNGPIGFRLARALPLGAAAPLRNTLEGRRK